MPFYNQSWFWVGFFTAIASLGGILIKELISTRSQAKIERLRLYESEIFKAYNNLYHFVSHAYEVLWPPEHRYQNFIGLMKRSYFKDVKVNMLFFNSEIRKTLGKLEAQYDCLGDPDLIPEKPVEEFLDEDISKLLYSLEEAIENRTDRILHKGT